VFCGQVPPKSPKTSPAEQAFNLLAAEITVDVAATLTHQSVIKTTFLLYFMLLGGMMATCDEMGAVLIIGHWRPFG
jgi:hypothetical protein